MHYYSVFKDRALSGKRKQYRWASYLSIAAVSLLDGLSTATPPRELHIPFRRWETFSVRVNCSSTGEDRAPVLRRNFFFDAP